jgi:hypothetical protein
MLVAEARAERAYQQQVQAAELDLRAELDRLRRDLSDAALAKLPAGLNAHGGRDALPAAPAVICAKRRRRSNATNSWRSSTPATCSACKTGRNSPAKPRPASN